MLCVLFNCLFRQYPISPERFILYIAYTCILGPQDPFCDSFALTTVKALCQDIRGFVWRGLANANGDISGARFASATK